MKVLFAASEIAPWVKTGGLGDVAGALPAALVRAGCDVCVLVPAYPALMLAMTSRVCVATFEGDGWPAGCRLWRATPPHGPGLLLLQASGLFDREGNPYLGPDGRDWPDNGLRFGLLARVAALLASPGSPLDWRPDVLHCNDWQTALAPAFIRYVHDGAGAASLVTVHNLAFMGRFGRDVLAPLGLPEAAFTPAGVEFYGDVSFLKAGLQLADRITTVSPTYAREIQEPAFGFGLEGLLRHRSDCLAGILNGIDQDVWNPVCDTAIACRYDAQRLTLKARNRDALRAQLGLSADGAMLFGVVSRLTEQKGLDLLLAVADTLVAEGAQLAVLGTGEGWMEQGFRDLAARHPGRCSVTIGFDEALAHRIEAGADAFVMPSRFEPCGLNQMYSLRYGTLPVVRMTGGLADTVVDASQGSHGAVLANGFVFDDASPQALLAALRRAMHARADEAGWSALMRAAMAADHSWDAAAARYLEQYQLALRDAAGRTG